MNHLNTADVYWKLENGDTILLSNLEEEHFIKANLVIQKRQVEAYMALEMSFKMEHAMIKVAKERGITLIPLDESDKKPFIKQKFNEVKGILKRINNSIKLKVNKDVKDKVILQSSNS